MQYAKPHSDATISNTLRNAAQRLEPGSSPRLDAEILLSTVLGKPRSYLHTWPQDQLTQAQHLAFLKLIERRGEGEPVAYLTGQQEFWSLTYQVTPHTLIPRPETEHLVELALRQIPEDGCYRIADLGTGPGTIALALAHERPRCHVMAIDFCTQALQVAKANVLHMGIANVTFRQSDWFSNLAQERFDLITANPPYIRDNDPYLSQKELQYEPVAALISGPNGLEAIETIIAGAKSHLKKGACLLLEHGYDQGPETADLLRHYGYHDVVGYKDYAGHDRNTIGRYNPA